MGLTATFLFGFFLTGALADNLNCSGSHEISRPANLNDSWYWPEGWTDSMNYVPSFSAGQNCVWKFMIPKGMYAYFGASFTSSDPKTILKMTDSIGYVTTFNASDFNHPFFLVDPGFTVELQSSSVGHLGMRVAWFEIPQTTSTTLRVLPNETPLALVGDTFNNATTIRAESRVSLVSIVPKQATDYNVPTMRLTLVFDGPSINSPFVGNLWQVMASENHLVSSGQYLTLLSVWPGENLGNVAIIQDYTNVQRFSSYRGINCYLNTKCEFSIDSQKGKAAAVRYSESPQYLISLDFPNSHGVNVYSGALVNESIVVEYRQSNTTGFLPQKFESLLTTYEVDGAVGNFQITGRSDETYWASIFNGRQGVISSKNIGVPTADQEFSDSFSGKGYFALALTVSKTDLSGSASLQITVLQDKNTVYDTTFTSQNPPNKYLNFTGNTLNVQYKTQGTRTTGSHVEFAFYRTNGMAVNGVLLVFMLGLMLIQLIL